MLHEGSRGLAAQVPASIDAAGPWGPVVSSAAKWAETPESGVSLCPRTQCAANAILFFCN